MRKLQLLFFALLAVLSSCKVGKSSGSPAIPADKEIEAKVNKTLSGMSLEEKVGQIVQLEVGALLKDDESGLDSAKIKEAFGKYKIGSILNAYLVTAHDRFTVADIISQLQEASMREIGIPCVYGLDMIHGATYLTEGTIFPQELNLAASFNPEHAEAMGRIIAYETRAAMCPWVFSPVMDLGTDPRWARIYESWGEDSYVHEVFSLAEVRGLQGDDPNHIGLENVAAGVKHYLGYGSPVSGKDRTPAYIPENTLREKYFTPFEACFRAGALNVMINSASINDIPTHKNKKLIQGWLKDGLDWDGMVVTDMGDVNHFWRRDHVAENRKEGLVMALNAGIDMIMEPSDATACDEIIEAVKEGLIPQSRIDDACRRILRFKYRLGLFDNPVWDIQGYDKVASDEFKACALKAALESEVLLKNEGAILPLKEGTKILLTGPNANSMRAINGGWTYQWQGTDDPKYTEPFNTIYEALCNRFGAGNVRYVPGVEYNPEFYKWAEEQNVDINSAVAAARSADVIVACIGENSYSETPGNLEDLNLSANQQELVKALAKTGKPIVLILNEGRPRIIREIEPLASAVVDIMLPGNYGGDALAMLLAGDANFCAKLPITYPKYANDLRPYDHKISEPVEVQWPFGFGLSYTRFEYSNLTCDKTEFGADDVLNFSVDVKNVGPVDGNEPVLLYSSDMVAGIIPDAKRLRAFEQINLRAGESRTVSFSVPARRLAFVDEDGAWRLEKGEFRITIDNQNITLNCKETILF